MVLLLVGFAVPPSLPKTRWALTPPFHPYLVNLWRTTDRQGGLLFCGTVLGVAATGRYPAPCSSELGLSSRPFPKEEASDHLDNVDKRKHAAERLLPQGLNWRRLASSVAKRGKLRQPAGPRHHCMNLGSSRRTRPRALESRSFQPCRVPRPCERTQ